MFTTVEKDSNNMFGLTIGIVYLAIAFAVDLGAFYVTLFPGSSSEERFARGMTGMLMILLSAVLCAPLFPYVVWKLVKHERPTFWGIALLIAAVPILEILVVTIAGSASY